MVQIAVVKALCVLLLFMLGCRRIFRQYDVSVTLSILALTLIVRFVDSTTYRLQSQFSLVRLVTQASATVKASRCCARYGSLSEQSVTTSHQIEYGIDATVSSTLTLVLLTSKFIGYIHLSAYVFNKLLSFPIFKIESLYVYRNNYRRQGRQRLQD